VFIFEVSALFAVKINYGTMLVYSLTTKKTKLMKTSTNATVISKAIDLELRMLLQQDLERFKMMKENKQASIKKAA
jgi:hypothetical protein